MPRQPDTDRNIVTRKAAGRQADLMVPPVLFMLFNRAATTREVFEKVREARPARIYVAANGPRPDVPSDQEKCAEVQAIFDGVDWDCEVWTNFRKTNIGMQRHWRSSLDWFFENVEGGIILEDDCVPHPSFFTYSTELLERYKNDDRIMHINGSNFQFGRKRGNASYYFSKYPHVWGWATWRRAWNAYDDSLSSLALFKERHLIDTAVSTEREKKYWMRFFDGLASGIYDTCDAKWIYAVWAREGLCITPNANLITNVGHGFDAGHTILKEGTMGQPSANIGAIIHPSSVNVDYEADRYTFKTYFYRTIFQKTVYKTVQALTRLRNK